MTTIIKATGKATDLTLPILTLNLLLEPYSSSLDRVYSLNRRIRGGYSGPLMKVRRSSDSTTLDIGTETSNLVLDATLTNFAAGSDLFIHTLFDQSVNAKHLTQSTTTRQPKLATAGVLNKVNGKLSAIFDGVDDMMTGGAPGLYAAGSMTHLLVLKAAIPTAAARLWTESIAADGNGIQYGLQAPDSMDNRATSLNYANGSVTSVKGTFASWDNTLRQYTAKDTGNTFSHWVDNNADSVMNTAYTRGTVTARDTFTLGGVTRAAGFGNFAMNFSEGIWAKTALNDTQRLELQANQKAFYATL